MHSWPGACNQLVVHPSLILRICIRTVCLWSLLDGIPLDHWNRFITKTLLHSKPDESVTLLIWVRLPLPTKSPFSSPRHRSRDHRIPPDKSASRPFRPRFSVARTPSSSSSTSTSPRRLSAGAWWSEFCACAPLGEDETEEYCLVVVGNKTDLVTLVSSSDGRAVSEPQRKLPWTSSTNSSCRRAPHPVSRRHRRTKGTGRLGIYLATLPVGPTPRLSFTMTRP